MYYVLGPSQVLETIIALAHPHLGDAEEPWSAKALADGHRRFLNAIQPSVPQSEGGRAFVEDVSALEKLVQLFNVDTALNDVGHVMNLKSDPGVTALAKAGYDAVATRSPVWASFFELSVHSIFCAPSGAAGGGTTSAAIGAIWVDPRPSWSVDDFNELYVHELAHTLVFLDELRFQHYTDLKQVAAPGNYAWSAILCLDRPLDKVLHSLMVATEILLLREHSIGHPDEHRRPKVHPPSGTLLRQAQETIRDLESKSHLATVLSPRAWELIATAKRLLTAIHLPNEKGPHEIA